MMSLFNRSKKETDETKTNDTKNEDEFWEIIEENDEHHEQLNVNSPAPYFVLEGELLEEFFFNSDLNIDTGYVWKGSIERIAQNYGEHIHANVQIQDDFTIDIKTIHVKDLTDELVYRIAHDIHKEDLNFNPLSETETESPITIRCH